MGRKYYKAKSVYAGFMGALRGEAAIEYLALLQEIASGRLTVKEAAKEWYNQHPETYEDVVKVLLELDKNKS